MEMQAVLRELCDSGNNQQETKLMICYVFKPVRRGKRARLYSGRYRLKGDMKPITVPLHLMERPLAEAKLRKIVKEKEQEAEGWIAPARVRDAAQKPLGEHLAAFVRDQIAKGRVARYVENIEMSLGVLIEECGWKCAQQVTASSFVEWRQRQEKSPKTLNEYLGNAKVFLNWMVRMGFIAAKTPWPRWRKPAPWAARRVRDGPTARKRFSDYWRWLVLERLFT